MKELQKLFDRIVMRTNINLREQDIDVRPAVEGVIPFSQLVKFYAFYGLTPHHPLDFQFRHSSLAGSYFLGKCEVNDSILYKSDVRGDELKHKGDVYHHGEQQIPVTRDEGIEINTSFLIKTLVHCFSHDPETLESFYINDTVSTHYANIHGAPMNGCFLGPFATVDLTTASDSVIGAFSYVQAGEINHVQVGPGTVWVRSPGNFNFVYRHPLNKLKAYVEDVPGQAPKGIIADFIDERKKDFEPVYNMVKVDASVTVPENASLDRFAVIRPQTHIGENVLVSQRAYLENAWMGKGANAQENCYIVNSHLAGNNVTAHGAKIIHAQMGETVFVGFNSFLQGRPDAPLTVGNECVVMPHTIIDSEAPLTIPAGSLVWGLIQNQADLEQNSLPLKELSQIDTRVSRGSMHFEGNGAAFVSGFQGRIHHILDSNGAFFDGDNNRGHAQKNQKISFNTIQPYPDGELEGLYPSIFIKP